MFIIIENETEFEKICTLRGWDAGAYTEEIERTIKLHGDDRMSHDFEYRGESGVYADKVIKIYPQRVKVEDKETGDERIRDIDDIPEGYEIVDVVSRGVYRFIEDKRITEEEEYIDEVDDYFGSALRD